jgi:hypothetical protein
MESPDEIKPHQRMERGKEGKEWFWEGGVTNELQYELIKKIGKGTSLGWSRQES